MNKPNAVCIFAHPDDESFGPSGTIHLLTKTHNVYIVCVTKGDAGENYHPDKVTPLWQLRKKELEESSSVLGVKKVFFLGYEDGSLNNNKYHEIAADVQKILDDLRPELLLTMEHHGISGHIDHIAVSMISSYLYERLSFIKKIMFYCLTPDQIIFKSGEYFIFFPPGYPKSKIDKTFDVSSIMDIKKKAMIQHQSQAKDLNRLLPNINDKENFYVWKKSATPKSSE